ncbi:hypothetical protein PNOK_0291400 [Pyrrhoderma noxium]|uniref:Adhesin domain-containing protein n=1 Tax=Pyrrhoderma noxium TaxID=2282107 RepID=A0A286UKZ5_9AGAM|nr:hypothetical protein PNOK_0291400 [Pyrrhoderma noxium]
MLLLKLKSEHDQYRPIPTDASNSSTNPLAPPPYRDDDCDRESAIVLDTSIGRPKRKRSTLGKCCVCCGLNCGYFFLSLGIVILGYLAWSIIKLVWWAATPAPSGLENIPKFSTSLGCLDASHLFTDPEAQGTLNHNSLLYTMDVDSDAGFQLRLFGGAVGTLVLAPSLASDTDNTTVALHTSIRTNEKGLLSQVKIEKSRTGKSSLGIQTPSSSENEDACMRYDLKLYLPPALRHLTIASQSVVQVKFSDEFTPAFSRLETVIIKLSSISSGGYLSGSLSISGSTSINTGTGDAITNVKLVTTESSFVESKLSTKTGSGQSTFVYENLESKRVQNEHRVFGKGDLRLTYEKARFNGIVDINAQSYSLSGVRKDLESDLRYVGNKEGGDSLKIISDGWVKVNF